MTPQRRPARVHVLVLLGYLLLTVVMTWPLALNLTTAIPGDSFDGWQNYWNLWWIKTAMVEQLRSPLVTDLLYAPTGVSLYFHTLNPFNGLLTLPVQLAGSLILAYNATVFFSWTVAGYGVYLLTRNRLAHAADVDRRGVNLDAGAFLAGVIFTFAPLHMAHLLGHMQVFSLQWIPFYVLYLLRSLDRVESGRSWWRSALLAGLFLTLVGLCDWYFVLYLFFFTGLALLWSWGRTVLRLSRAQSLTVAAAARALVATVAPALVAGGLFLLLLSPQIVPMVGEATRFSFMVRPSSDLYILSASVMDFLVPNRLHTLFRPESFDWVGNQIAPVSERTISVGYLALVLAGLGLWRLRAGRFWALVALFFFFMALGPVITLGDITWDSIPAAGDAVTGWTPFATLNRVIPFMRISRSVSRYALMVQLAVALLAGMGSAWLLARVRTPGRTAVLFALILAMMLGEYWVAPYPLSPPDTPGYYAELAQEPGSGSVLNLPMNYDRPGYLLYQTVHGRPLAVAYISRDDPRTLTERVPLLQHLRHLRDDIITVDPAGVGATVLTDLGIEYVVLDRYKMPGGLERSYTDDMAGRLFTGQPPVYEDDRLTVYRVAPPDQPAPYLALGALNWGPLTPAEDTVEPARELLPGEARIELHHAPPAAQVRLRYRTTADAGLTVRQGAERAPLPPQPNGGTVLLPAADYLVASAQGEPDAIVLEVAEPGTVWVEAIGLE